MHIQTTITFIVHNIVSKQITARKEGQKTTGCKAAKSQIRITDKKL